MKTDKIFESNNPMLKEKNYRGALDAEMVGQRTVPMTVNGAVNKTLALFGIMLITAVFSYMYPNQILIYGGVIGGAIISFIASRNLEKSAIFAPLFAAFEGLFVGGITAIYAARTEGILFHAVTLTMAILLVMLLLYKTGTIKVTERFRSIIMTATGAIMLVYLVSFVLGMLGITVPFLHQSSPIGIGISLFIVCIASLKLLVDFDNFDIGAAAKMPNYMEWYFGMGLFFTLIWLYVEILWLLSNFLGND